MTDANESLTGVVNLDASEWLATVQKLVEQNDKWQKALADMGKATTDSVTAMNKAEVAAKKQAKARLDHERITERAAKAERILAREYPNVVKGLSQNEIRLKALERARIKDESALLRWKIGMEKSERAAKAHAASLAKDASAMINFGNVLRSVLSVLTSWKTILTTIIAGGGFTAFIKHAMDAGDELNKMAIRTGLAEGFLAKMKYATDLSGSSLDSFEKAVKKMSVSVVDAARGTGTAKLALDQLGISIFDTAGKLKEPAELFLETATALSKIENATTKAALAQAIFGRAGTELLPLLNEGSRGIAELTKNYDKLTGMTNEQVATHATLGAQFKDSLTNITFAADGLGNAIAVSLFPTLTSGAQKMTDWIIKNRELVSTKVSEWLKAVISTGKGFLVWASKTIDSLGGVQGILLKLETGFKGAINWLRDTAGITDRLADGNIKLKDAVILVTGAYVGTIAAINASTAAMNAWTAATTFATSAAGLLAAKIAAVAAVGVGAYMAGDWIGEKTGFHEWASDVMADLTGINDELERAKQVDPKDMTKSRFFDEFADKVGIARQQVSNFFKTLDAAGVENIALSPKDVEGTEKFYRLLKDIEQQHGLTTEGVRKYIDQMNKAKEAADALAESVEKVGQASDAGKVTYDPAADIARERESAIKAWTEKEINAKRSLAEQLEELDKRMTEKLQNEFADREKLLAEYNREVARLYDEDKRRQQQAAEEAKRKTLEQEREKHERTKEMLNRTVRTYEEIYKKATDAHKKHIEDLKRLDQERINFLTSMEEKRFRVGLEGADESDQMAALIERTAQFERLAEEAAARGDYERAREFMERKTTLDDELYQRRKTAEQNLAELEQSLDDKRRERKIATEDEQRKVEQARQAVDVSSEYTREGYLEKLSQMEAQVSAFYEAQRKTEEVAAQAEMVKAEKAKSVLDELKIKLDELKDKKITVDVVVNAPASLGMTTANTAAAETATPLRATGTDGAQAVPVSGAPGFSVVVNNYGAGQLTDSQVKQVLDRGLQLVRRNQAAPLTQ